MFLYLEFYALHCAPLDFVLQSPSPHCSIWIEMEGGIDKCGVELVFFYIALAHAQDEEFTEMVAVLKWSCAAINRFWRVIYGNGIWLHQGLAWQTVRDGWAFLET